MRLSLEKQEFTRRLAINSVVQNIIEDHLFEWSNKRTIELIENEIALVVSQKYWKVDKVTLKFTDEQKTCVDLMNTEIIFGDDCVV